MWHLTACKILVSLPFWKLDKKNEMIFYRIAKLMLVTLIQRYDKNIFSFQERETSWNFTGFQLSHFVIVLIPYINLLNLSWIIKCLFLRNIEPLKCMRDIKYGKKHIMAYTYRLAIVVCRRIWIVKLFWIDWLIVFVNFCPVALIWHFSKTRFQTS